MEGIGSKREAATLYDSVCYQTQLLWRGTHWPGYETSEVCRLAVSVK